MFIKEFVCIEIQNWVLKQGCPKPGEQIAAISEKRKLRAVKTKTLFLVEFFI